MVNPIYTLRAKGKLLTLQTPVVMGIINVTPDSFYAGSRRQGEEEVLAQAAQMLDEGATFLDLGGQSTRPGAAWLTWEEEADRVLPAIAAIHARYPEAWLSVDTFYPEVAEAAVAAGASVVNDVSGGMLYADMLDRVAALRVPYICMHMPGTPATMQQHAHYDDVVTSVLDFFMERTEACRKAGIHDVIIDPGFGFGKTIAHNYQLLRHLSAFQMLQKPVLAGLSRKATIYKTLNITPAEALNGTTVLNTIALQQGASVLRVHDVKPAMEVVKLMTALAQA